MSLGLSGYEVREVGPDEIDSINVMCTMPGSDPRAVLEESAGVHKHVASYGVRTLAAFEGGEPVARLEIMPVHAAPLALVGDDLWVIRCLWVLERAQGRGLAKILIERAKEMAAGSRGIAVVTYEKWMPVEFFERFGFELVGRKGTSYLLLLKMQPGATVSFGPAPTASGTDRSIEREFVTVEGVFTGRCPWLIQTWRRWLKEARNVSDRVVTSERVIFTRDDAIRFGDENIYIDGIPFEQAPFDLDGFRKAIADRLRAKGLT